MSLLEGTIVLAIISALGVLVGLHDVAGTIAAPIYTAIVSGTLGYVKGKSE